MAARSAGHTPGPWQLDPLDRNEQRPVSGAHGRLVAVCAHECVKSLIPEMEANAHLIAAAPDMLEALRAAESILWMAEQYAEAGGSGGPEMRDYTPAAAEIRAAIAKAEGRPAPEKEGK